MKNHYKERITELLEKNMTEKGFKLWRGIDSILPDVWSKPTSSTKKYHKKLNGDVPDIAEHVYHMIYTGIKLLKMFDIDPQTSDSDKILFALVLHDSIKYGNLGTRKYCDNTHDKEAADMISSNKDTFKKILSDDEFQILEEAVRFHSGQWSTDVPKNRKFNWQEYNPETLFVHMLDMLSTYDLIQTDVRE